MAPVIAPRRSALDHLIAVIAAFQAHLKTAGDSGAGQRNDDSGHSGAYHR